MIVLDDLLKTLGYAYILGTYVHQPYVGAVYGKIVQQLEERLTDPGTYTEDLASYIQSQNIQTLKMLLKRELEQLKQEGYDIIVKPKHDSEKIH